MISQTRCGHRHDSMSPKPGKDLKPLETRLRAAPPLNASSWDRIRRDLATRATAEHLIDIAFERHDSPLGPILLGATPAGLVRLGLPAEGEDAVLDEIAHRISPRVLCASRTVTTQARHQLDEYFTGHRQRFDLPLDWQLTKGFRRDVLHATARIPYGHTASYRDMATAAGSPAAVRAAGTALATNPLPIIVPCHRVLPSSGGVGSYRGGSAAKAQLLDLEKTA